MMRPIIGTVLTAGALVLMLSFKTPTPIAPISGQAGGGGTANLSNASPGSRSGTATGSAIQTPYGIVQVRVTEQNGRITDVAIVQAPNDNGRSAAIVNYAAPVLRGEALTAQSAAIDTVSGATYTSQGYIASLQSALDQIAA